MSWFPMVFPVKRRRGPAVLSPVAALLPALLLFPARPLPAQGTPPACSTGEFHQFDFWLGEWTVRLPSGDIAGESSIRKILNGCVIHERYQTPSGYEGESFNIFDAGRGVWHQSWVDLGGTLLLLEGGFSDGKMVLEGTTTGPHGPVRQRISWKVVEGNPDRVRQLWESSGDGGESWQVVFDGLYVRK